MCLSVSTHSRQSPLIQINVLQRHRPSVCICVCCELSAWLWEKVYLIRHLYVFVCVSVHINVWTTSPFTTHTHGAVLIKQTCVLLHDLRLTLFSPFTFTSDVLKPAMPLQKCILYFFSTSLVFIRIEVIWGWKLKKKLILFSATVIQYY